MNEQTNNNMDQDLELLATIELIKSEPRKTGGGMWVTLRMGGHRIEALVFEDHADDPDYELEGSRISKMDICRIADRVMVAAFDRGWVIRPTTPIAQRIVELLSEGLADFVYEEA